MDMNKFRKYAGTALVVSALFIAGYGATSTYQNVHGEHEYTATEFVTKGSAHVADKLGQKAEQNLQQSVVSRQHAHVARVQRQAKPSRAEAKRLSAVAKYITVNDHGKHGVKNAVYNAKTGQVNIHLNTKHPTAVQKQYVHHLFSEFNAE